MQYTVEDLVQERIVRKIRPLTAVEHPDRIAIRSVSVQELPMEGFVRRGELVLTTALGCEKDPELFLQLVEEAITAQVAAVLFAFPDPLVTVPTPALERAECAGLPLFQIPWEYRFSKIQDTITDRIREKELTELQGLQNHLFNAFFEGRTLEQAAQAIGNVLDMDVVICDKFDEAWGSSIRKTGEDRVRRGAPIISLDITISKTLFGRLHLYADTGEHRIDPATAAPWLKQYVVFPLAMWFNKKNIEDMTTLRLKNDFVYNLAKGNYSSYSLMLQQAVNLHFDLSRPYTCVVMQPADNDVDMTGYSKRAARVSDDLENILLREGKKRGQRIMISNLGMEFIIYLENSATPEKDVLDYVNTAEVLLKKAYPALTPFWGISEPGPANPDFSALYQNARLALDYCKKSRNDCHYFVFRDTRKALIISALSEHPDIRQAVQDTLAQLLEYDARSNGDLMLTLTTYISNNYNISRTAKQLNIHRQSLLYRLDKIATLTGMSLNDHEDLFVLETFCRLHTGF